MSEDALDTLVSRIMPDQARAVVLAWLGATTSPPIALLSLLTIFREPEDVVSLLSGVIDHILKTFPRDSEPYRRATAMQLFLKQHRSGLDQVGSLLRLEQQQQISWSSVPIAQWAALFDAWVQRSEAASVALYSLGDASVLAAVTAEVVELLERWELLGSDRRILQIGCGTGRFEATLAGRVQSAYGIDISARMIAVAQRNCAALKNVHLMTCSGSDLRLFKSQMFDLVYAVDTFPYLHASGFGLVATHFQEVLRVLRPRGNFVIFNFSYRNSPELDRDEIAQLAKQYGFEVLENGAQLFRVWDGLAWRLRRGS
jgi:SAM-dependent methyltransferase